ncbi:MAG TPA: prolyl oligopeptidase family serine peptidase [Methylibium sp.]|nr:prolyl oligopeptidase family serine peptidase [Methylibium sp.]
MLRSRPFSTFIRRLLAAIGVAASALPALAADAPPVADFFRLPLVDNAKMSPSGRYIAATAGTDVGRMQLAVIELGEKMSVKVVAGSGDADVDEFHWVNDERIVYTLSDNSRAGAYRAGTGLFAVNRDGSGHRELIERRTHFERRASTIERRVLPWNFVFHAARGGESNVVVQEYKFDDTGELRNTVLHLLDTTTGQRRAHPGPRDARVLEWTVDVLGVPRAAVAHEGPNVRVFVRQGESDNWAVVATGDRNKGDYPDPIAIDGAGSLYTLGGHGPRRTTAMFRFDIEKRARDPEPIIAVAGFSFDGQLVQDSKTGRLIGAVYTADAVATHWFDPKLRDLQKRIDAALPDTVNIVSCGRCEEPNRLLVRTFSDRQPNQYYVFDVAANALSRIGQSRPWLDPARMGTEDFLEFEARDGLKIPMYVTRPAVGKGPWPAVVMVHGGPWVRGRSWGFDAEAQFLASRGYVVLQPEFRGSAGFGFNHFTAGWRQWGQAMQDDLVDALGAAAKRGWADSKRACIAGASYGGYAALMGLVRPTDPYRCAVSWAAVTDIDLMYSVHWSDISADAKAYGYPVLIGDPKQDAAMLAANSPLKQADKIQRPLLLAHGGADRRVPIEHANRLRDALKASKADVEWVLYADEGHGWALPANDVDFWSRVEKFLAKHLAP